MTVEQLRTLTDAELEAALVIWGEVAAGRLPPDAVEAFVLARAAVDA